MLVAFCVGEPAAVMSLNSLTDPLAHTLTNRSHAGMLVPTRDNDLVKAQQCRSTNLLASAQHRWESYVITVNATARRTLRTVKLLESLNISVHMYRAVPAQSQTEMGKVRSNLLTQRGIYDEVAISEGSPDDYVLVFEDDVMVTPAVPRKNVPRLLACGAALSLSRRLPLFYAGACAPRDLGNHLIDDDHEEIAHQPMASAVRVSARCAHAYAIRRGDAAVLRTLADKRPDRGPSQMPGRSRRDKAWYMDVQLDYFAQEQGGVFLVAPRARPPQDPAMRGIFYQDRAMFPSDIKMT